MGLPRKSFGGEYENGDGWMDRKMDVWVDAPVVQDHLPPSFRKDAVPLRCIDGHWTSLLVGSQATMPLRP